jgi:heme/copper-type cytochrome/quinol oxidase subunit 2
MDDKSVYQATMLAGTLLVGLGIFFEIMADYNRIIILTLVNMGVILLVMAVLKYNNLAAGVKQDERTKTLSMKAISHSWLITFIIANTLFWLIQLEILKLNGTQAIGAMIFAMIMSAGLLQGLYKHKGVIDEDKD